MASTYFRPVVLLTAILTLAQAIAWFVLSLLGVLAYRCELPIPEQPSVGAKFTALLYHLYFEGPGCQGGINIPGLPPNVHIHDAVYANPSYINAWMASYLALNITYFLIAINMFVELCKSVNGSYSLTTLRLWCLNTLAFLIMDLWLTIVWGADFQYLNNFIELYEDDLKGTFGWATSVPGALMAITARGFILYIINFILFCYLLRFTFNWRSLVNNGCCQQNNGGSQQQLHPNYPMGDPDRMGKGPYHHSIPRINSESWDNGQVLVPVNNGARYVNPHSGPIPHPNAVEGVTSFNDWYGVPQRQSRHLLFEEDLRAESKSLGRSRPPSPPRRPREEEVFQGTGRPSVRSAFEYPDRRNFEQGGNSKPVGRGAKPSQRNNDLYY